MVCCAVLILGGCLLICVAILEAKHQTGLYSGTYCTRHSNGEVNFEEAKHQPGTFLGYFCVTFCFKVQHGIALGWDRNSALIALCYQYIAQRTSTCNSSYPAKRSEIVNFYGKGNCKATSGHRHRCMWRDQKRTDRTKKFTLDIKKLLIFVQSCCVRLCSSNYRSDSPKTVQ